MSTNVPGASRGTGAPRGHSIVPGTDSRQPRAAAATAHGIGPVAPYSPRVRVRSSRSLSRLASRSAIVARLS
jgi:hypothetical protein